MLAFGYHGVQQKNKRFEHDSGLPPAASSGSKRWKVALSAKVWGVAFDNQISENPALKFILNLA
jgi:hypothetical protein